MMSTSPHPPGLTPMSPAHEPTAWSRGRLDAAIRRYDVGEVEPGCAHLLPGSTAVIALWAQGRAVCESCSQAWRQESRNVCDRCGRICNALTGTCTTTTPRLVTLFALCGDCLAAEWGTPGAMGKGERA